LEKASLSLSLPLPIPLLNRLLLLLLLLPRLSMSLPLSLLPLSLSLSLLLSLELPTNQLKTDQKPFLPNRSAEDRSLSTFSNAFDSSPTMKRDLWAIQSGQWCEQSQALRIAQSTCRDFSLIKCHAWTTNPMNNWVFF